MTYLVWKNPLIILILALLLGGCAFGNTVDYNTGSVDYNTGISEEANFIVAFQDVRPYVLSGDKKPTFVGLSRSIAGVPYPVNTKSGQPLANDFGSLVSNSLKEKGLNAEYISFQFRKDVDEFVKENSKDGMKILVFSLYEWKTDVHFTSSIHYNVKLTVYNSEGNKLADAEQRGSDPLGPNEREGRRSLAEANADIIGGLLKTPMIQEAILSDKFKAPADETVKPTSKKVENCSVQQVIKMKDAGLSSDQIEAACE